MKFFALLAAVLLTLAAADRHAIIIAPRDNWPDYGVQSESCRMYNDLVDAGVDPKNIILMSTTKLLTMSQNPFQNKLFTDDDPKGEGYDVAFPCMDKIDYESEHMTADIMVAIMKGDVESLKKMTGKDEPRALSSTEEDDIMLYFTSHGGPGTLLVGNTYLKREELERTIMYMYDNKMYRNFFFLLEACYSGSMFEQFPPGYRVYAITASDPKHSSYESHCPPNDSINGVHLNTCLSCYWDNAIEWFIEGGWDHTLDEVYQHSHDKVAESSGQNVSHYGDLEEMGKFTVEQFTGRIPPHPTRRMKSDDTYVAKADVPAHLALWKAIRAETDRKEAFEAYAALKVQQAKQGAEVMRLGVAVMGEKAANKSFQTSGAQYSESCVLELQMKLVSECKHTYPLPETTVNMIKNICLPGLRAPSIDYKDICM